MIEDGRHNCNTFWYIKKMSAYHRSGKVIFMKFKTISPEQVGRYAEWNVVVIVDLRTEEEYKRGHILKAVNIPYECIAEDKICLCKNRVYLFYCERGNLSLHTAWHLSEQGYHVMNMYGGIKNYKGELSIDES